MDPVDTVNFSETFDSAGEERKILFLSLLFLSILRESLAK